MHIKYLLDHKKEGNPIICDNMNKPGGNDTK